MIDTATVQWLNLLHGSPSFVLRVDPRDGRSTVLQLDVVPDDDGVYWIAGTTVVPRGDRVPSLFVVDTTTGGTLVSVYWRVSGSWVSSSEPEKLVGSLDAEKHEVFPFDWEYAVALTRDVYHDETD